MLRNMVTDILDQSRLDSGAIIASPEWFNAQALVEEIYRLLQNMVIQKNIDITIDVSQEVYSLKADTTHMRQILINIFSNAIKYNRQNGKVILKLHKSEDKNNLILSISDTGRGISSEKIPMLFMDYYRANLSDSSLIEGTGLGLAFVKKLVGLYGGTVSVESELEVGSTFTVVLPLTAENEILPIEVSHNSLTIESHI